MAKFLLVCPRSGHDLDVSDARMEAALAGSAPDHLVPTVDLASSEGVRTAVLNPSAAVRRTPRGLLLGAVRKRDADWHQPGSRPDGSFSICRWNADAVELVADTVASRTIWWVKTDRALIASSSQAAIVALLGDFEFDEAVVPWMLATGTLGPAGGWDRRIGRVPPEGVVRLDRAGWSVSVEAGEVAFRPDLADAETDTALEQAVADSFEQLDLSGGNWTLPLSGGADSRGILQQLLRTGRRPACITWGRREALTRSGTDAAVARTLATAESLRHDYLVIEPEALEPELLVERFLQNGEGRIDHVAAYLDGFESWRALNERGIELVLRGDEVFGWTEVDTEREARASVDLHLLGDFYTVKDLTALGLPGHQLPEDLRKRPEESVAAWRDRLYHQFRAPVMLAALTDLKLAYVELINPLISRRITETVRHMPDADRTEKRAWIRIVERGRPGGPFARSGALMEVDAVLKSPAFRDYLRRQVSNPAFARTFSPAFAEHLLGRLRPEGAGAGLKLRAQRWAKGVAPSWLIRLAKRRRTKRGPRLNGPTLALRAVIVARMRERLEAAAAGRALRDQAVGKAWQRAGMPTAA